MMAARRNYPLRGVIQLRADTPDQIYARYDMPR